MKLWLVNQHLNRLKIKLFFWKFNKKKWGRAQLWILYWIIFKTFERSVTLITYETRKPDYRCCQWVVSYSQRVPRADFDRRVLLSDRGSSFRSVRQQHPPLARPLPSRFLARVGAESGLLPVGHRQFSEQRRSYAASLGRPLGSVGALRGAASSRRVAQHSRRRRQYGAARRHATPRLCLHAAARGARRRSQCSQRRRFEIDILSRLCVKLAVSLQNGKQNLHKIGQFVMEQHSWVSATCGSGKSGVECTLLPDTYRISHIKRCMDFQS